MIKLQQALKILEQTDAAGRPKPVSILAIAADTNRGTGGDVLYFERAVLSRLANIGRPAKMNRRSKSGIQYHYKNRTRNVCELGTSEVRKIHIDLILQINGEDIS